MTGNDFTLSLREAVRGFARHKYLFAVTALTLTLGLSLCITMFCVLYGVLLKPLSYGDARLLVVGRAGYEGATSIQNKFTERAVAQWRESARTFEGLAAFSYWEYTLLGRGEPLDVEGAIVSPEFFTVLGAQPHLGTIISPELAQAERGKVVLLSHWLWRQRFGADPAIAGKAINLSGETYSIAGVMPQDFDVPSQQVAIWEPRLGDPGRTGNHRHLIVIGRLRPSVTLAQAEAEASGVARQLAAEYPDTNRGMRIYLVPFFNELIKDTRPFVLAASAAALLVLLICCANLSGLLLARTIEKRSEFATRLAIGARRGHLLGVVFSESLLLAICSGIAGAMLARWMIAILVRTAPLELPRGAAIGQGFQIPIVAAGLALIAALLISLPSAWEVIRFKPGLETGKGTRSTSRRFAHQLIATVELAIALTLLAGSGLMARTMLALRDANVGWKTDHLIGAQIYLPQRNYSEPHQIQQFFETFIERLRATPGVESVAASSALPPERTGIDFDLPIEVPGAATGASIDNAGRAHIRVVTPGLTETLGIPLLEGRTLNDGDQDPQLRRIMVNRMFARKYLPGSPSVVGKQVTIHFSSPQTYEIVGVVGDVYHYGLQEPPRPEFYLPFAAMPFSGMGVAVRTTGDPLAFAPEFRRQLWALDPELPANSMGTADDWMKETWRDRAFLTVLIVLVAAFAVVLTVIGIFSVVSFSVSRQSREIGIRMAMGARRDDVVRLVMGQSARAVAAGVVLGLFGVWMLSRWLAHVIYGVSSTDPWVLLGGAIGLAAVAGFGAWLPSRRAAKIDPIAALRAE